MQTMVIAGIDEAGYGPLLGPLVVGSSAFEIAHDGLADIPCMWQLLRRVASQKRDRTGKRLHINDSKQVYTRSTGLKELERAVLALANCRLSAGGASSPEGAPSLNGAGSLDELLMQVAPDAEGLADRITWYAADDTERFPLEIDTALPLLDANACRAEMARCDVSLVYLQAEVLDERRLNQMLHATRNKASVLFTAAMRHVDRLLKQFSDRGLLIVLDRQGGREHYGHLLRLMFEDWDLEVVSEADGESQYILRRNERSAHLQFREKAEVGCLSVAVASMLSKYLREALMNRFNQFWLKQQPTLQPTAGYYSDGMRFLRDIEDTRSKLGIGDDELIRAR